MYTYTYIYAYIYTDIHLSNNIIVITTCFNAQGASGIQNPFGFIGSGQAKRFVSKTGSIKAN